MNKKTTIISSVCAVLLTGMSFAQFTETMGTLTPNTETVNAREAGGRFAVASLTYSGFNSDVRITSPSHVPGTYPGYIGASGGHCVLLQPGNETFEIRTINTTACVSTPTLSFGVNKTLNASNGSELDVDCSVDGGVTWTPLTFAALPTGSGTSGSGSTAAWYLRSVTLPVSATVWVRFTNTQAGGSGDNPQFRIDDVSMTCGSTINCSSFTAAIDTAVGSPLTFCAGSSTTTLESTTNIGSPSYQWYYQDDTTPIVGATNEDLLDIEMSGTYYVKVSNGAGCTVTSNRIRILVYPTPQLCDATIEGCAGDTVEFCPELRTEDLIFSEYMEGSGFNKCIEIYNGTCEPRNSADYLLEMFVNGSPTPVVIPTTPNYVIAPGATYVICHDQYGGSFANKTTSLLAFNGNDALRLTNTTGGVVADIFGVVGENPGSSWRDTVNGSPTEDYSTEDLTLVRKPCVYSGITVNPALPGIYGFSTLFTEWDTLPQNTTTGFGSHTFTGEPYTFGGDANIVSGSETDECVDVVIGREPTTLEVFPTLCGFNNCGPVLVAVVDTCGGEARSMSAPVQGSTLKLQAFPNPTVDATTILFNQENDGVATITMTDLAGHVVLAQTVQATAGEQRIELNLAGLANGTYVCNVATANGFETVRIVKSK